MMTDQRTNNHTAIIEMEERPESPSPGKKAFEQFMELIKTNDVAHLDEIKTMLTFNTDLLKYIQIKNCKYRPLLHIFKYNKDLNSIYKYTIIECIIDVEYKTYIFSNEKSIDENFRTIFPVAAQGDYDMLVTIISYIKNKQPDKLQDTRNGDNVLTFMIKFGKLSSAPRILDCFNLLLQEGINYKRIDYFQDDVEAVIEKELYYYESNENVARAKTLREMLELLQDPPALPEITPKMKLFQMLITSELECSDLCQFDNESIRNADDGEHTLLQLATLKKRDDVVKYLLQRSVNPNHKVIDGNCNHPLTFAALLSRKQVLRELLQSKDLKITNDDFQTIMETKFIGEFLQWQKLDPHLDNDGKIPLYYAIRQSDSECIQRLFKSGTALPENCLNILNPKDVEAYFDSCLVNDSYTKHIDDYQCKLLVVFDFFLGYKSPEKENKPAADGLSRSEDDKDGLLLTNQHQDNGCTPNEVEKVKLLANYQPHDGSTSEQAKLSANQPDCPTAHEVKMAANHQLDEVKLSANQPDSFTSEVERVRLLASQDRLKPLLAHPLIQLLMILKWYCLSSYYYVILACKIFIYFLIVMTLSKDYLNALVYIIFLIIQSLIIWNHLLTISFDIHTVVECLVMLTALSMFPLLWLSESIDYMRQTSALLTIFISLSVMLTLGYHPKLSKWMAMLKRIFKTFTMLLLLFLIPISAFSLAFYNLQKKTINSNSSPKNKTVDDNEEEEETSDFEYVSTSMFRVFVMLSGDIGDGKYSSFVSYCVFLVFAVGMCIVVMNFWTGVAISDIKDIEEQSTVAAFANVIEYIESLEKLLYNFQNITKSFVIAKPFLRFYTLSNRKYEHTIELFLNKRVVVQNMFFKSLQIDKDLIDAIKSVKKIDDISVLLGRLEKLEKLIVESKPRRRR